jgi:hypothetical protein
MNKLLEDKPDDPVESIQKWAADALGRERLSSAPHEEVKHGPSRFRVFVTQLLPDIPVANGQATRSQFDVSNFPDDVMKHLIDWGLIGGHPLFTDILYGSFSSDVTDAANKADVSCSPDLVPGFFSEMETPEAADTLASKRGSFEPGDARSKLDFTRGEDKAHYPMSGPHDSDDSEVDNG